MMTAEAAILNILPEMGLDVTNPNLSDGSFQSRQLLSLINAAGRDIASRGEWSRLFRSFIADGDTDLPDDFDRLTESGAIWAGTTPVRVVLAPEQWAFLQARPSSQPYAHITGGQIRFSGLSGEATVRYVSENWVNGSQREVTQNGDTFAFPARLVEGGVIWRWRRQKGLPYDDFIAEHEAAVEAALKADRGMK